MGRLTIEQIIEHCEKTTKEYEEKVSDLFPIERTQSNRYWEHKQVTEYLKELQRYKDLEEQGRLIEQKHGQWIANKHMVKSPTAENYHCSECTQTGKRTQYCPNCGAKMELKELEG